MRKMHLLPFLLFIVLFLGTFPVAGNVEKTSRIPPARITSQTDRLPLPPTPQELEKQLKQDWDHTENWFFRERSALLRMGIGIAGSVLCTWLLRMLICWRLHRHEKRHGTGFPVRLLQAVNGTFWSIVGCIAAFLFMLPVLNALPFDIYPFDLRIFFTILTLLTVHAVYRLIGVVDTIVQESARRSGNQLDGLLIKVARKTTKITLAVLTVLFIGQSIFDINITTLLAGAGVIGLAVAFAARDTLSNFFGTIVILADRPFRVGDRVKINTIDGVVVDVGMRSTRIRTEDESVFSIPNSIMVTSPIENISSNGKLRYAFDLTMTYDTTGVQMEQAIALLHELVDHFHGPDAPGDEPRIYFSEFADWSMNVRVVMWLKTIEFKVEEAWKTELHLAILKRFRESGIQWAFPTSTVLVAGNPGDPVNVNAVAAPKAAPAIAGNTAPSR